MAKEALKLPRLLLYKQTASPPSNAVIMLGELIGLKFDYKEPALLKLEHKSPEFKKINPMGTIPVLQDGDFIVSESHAIMKYLLGKYGDESHERLYPRDVRQRAIVDQCLFYDAGVYFNRLRYVSFPTLMAGFGKPTQAQLDDIDESYWVLEAYLQNNKYIATNHLTIADLSLGTTTTAMQVIHKMDENRYPRCAEWLALLKSEEFFEKINTPGVAKFTKLLQMFWEKNKKN